MQVNPTWNYYKAKVKATLSSDKGKAIYRRRKYDVEPVFGHMKRDFGVRRTHLRGQRAVENDTGLTLMAMNLTKLGKLIAQAGTKLIEKGKIRTIISGKSKIMVRILIFRGRNLIVNSQPHFCLTYNQFFIRINIFVNLGTYSCNDLQILLTKR
ncbi:transposase [Limosilactobacillus reuteri I5007]|uniref:Transposase n=24 Tax=Limosilactobacillus reuteri TaxID=1598 RepID=R9WF79_LIMRT|nr:transposase [Limosilactobacillus reuteri I5007]